MHANVTLWKSALHQTQLSPTSENESYYQYPLILLSPFIISGVSLCFFKLLNWAWYNVLHVIFIPVYKTSPCLAWFDNTNKQFTNWCKPIWNYIWSTLQPLPPSLELRDASSSRRPIRVKYRLWRALQLDYAKIISRAEEISESMSCTTQGGEQGWLKCSSICHTLWALSEPLILRLFG